MINYLHRKLIKRIAFLIFVYLILRLSFYIYHFSQYQNYSSQEILKSFYYGLRFDISALCWINIPVFLLSFLPFQTRWFEFFDRLVFVSVNSIAILVSINDLELYNFTGKRLSRDLFLIGSDIIAQLPQLAVHYWYFPMIAMIFFFITFRIDSKYSPYSPRDIAYFTHYLGLLVYGALLFVGIRGGFQLKSIDVQSAFVQNSQPLGQLVLNTPYHFLRTWKNTPLKPLIYFARDQDAIGEILNFQDHRSLAKANDQTNVVLIILESFSLEYFEEGLTPFLKDLSSRSLYFDKHLANGRKSIEALPSLLCGLPSLLNEPLSKSSFQANNFVCFPNILKKNGYTNVFFHGGAKGTMGFESYVLSHGYDKYFSREDYPGESHDDDGTWGIFDGPFFNFTLEKISQLKEPFHASIFSLSSHQPFKLPADLKDSYPEGALEIHKTIRYVDDVLKDFFAKASQKSWFKNTLFIITADHTHRQLGAKFQNIIGDYRVPLIWYQNDIKFEGVNTQKVTQHADIPRSVLSYLKFPDDELALTSGNVLNWQSEGMALIYAHNHYYGVQQSLIYEVNSLGHSKAFSYDWDTGVQSHSSLADEEARLVKAYLQYFQNGLIKNNLKIY